MVKIYADSTPILFSNFSYKQHLHNPDTVSFESTTLIQNGSDIKVIGNFPDFGGKVQTSNRATGIEPYDCIDYTDLLRGKVKQTFTKKTGSQILKTILKDRKVLTGGITNTNKKHKQLIFKDVRAIDVCHQIATLEKYEFSVNSNRIGVFKKQSQSGKGIVLKPGDYSDYSQTTDSSNIITGVKVYGKKNAKTLLYAYNNKDLTAKYGVITELIIDDKIKTKAKAKAKATELFKKEGNAELVGTITIPALAKYKDLKPEDLIVIYDAKGNLKSFFIEEITNTFTKRTLKLMGSKTPVPSSWIYNVSKASASSDSEISKAVSEINKKYRHIRYSGCDCFCTSEKIFQALKAKKIPCRIVVKHSNLASSGTHRYVEYKNSKGWKPFNYSGFDGKLVATPKARFIKYLKVYNG